MVDSSGRTIDYMRISITDRCNLRCRYCMPEGIDYVDMSEILSFEEIVTCVTAAASLGIRHIKITGGEPLVRRGCVDLIKMIKQIKGIEKVSITTNGVLLSRYINELKDAGLDGINVSLDTLDRKRYAQITGFDEFDNVISGIKDAMACGIKTKINCVSMYGEKESLFFDDVADLIELTRNTNLDVRFIEMMPIGMGKNIRPLNHKLIISELKKRFPEMKPDDSVHGAGPAVYFKLPNYVGCIGFISALHGKFCENCNRIRLSSQGDLKGCLCYESGENLKPILRSKQNEAIIIEDVRNAIEKTILNKPKAHCFEQIEDVTEELFMASIGG